MTNKESEILIDVNDFKSIDLQINFANTTTNSQIKDGKRFYGIDASTQAGGSKNENLEISILEFLENGLILDIPSKTCMAKHSVMVEVYNKNPPLHFKATAKVKTVESLSPENDQVEIVFVQKNEKEWEELQNVFNNRQQEIREFLNSVKGFEST